jgi:hypothetical protein
MNRRVRPATVLGKALAAKGVKKSELPSGIAERPTELICLL